MMGSGPSTVRYTGLPLIPAAMPPTSVIAGSVDSNMTSLPQ